MGEMAHETMAQATERAQRELSGEQTPAPGTEETPTPTPAPSAGTENAETEQSGSTPETVPYSRFKEVNDRLASLRGFAPVAEAGYEPDSVARLVAFEQAYIEDPVGTIAEQIDNLDLPDATKAAVKTLMSGQPAQTESTESEESDEAPPKWAEPLIQDHESRTQAEEDQHYNTLLDKTIEHWNKLDKDDDLETPTRTQLIHIRAAADRGGFETVEQLAEAARGDLMEYRDHALGSAVRPSRTGPLSVPGSGVGSSEPVKYKSIQEATKAAEAAMSRGELPPLSTDEGM